MDKEGNGEKYTNYYTNTNKDILNSFITVFKNNIYKPAFENMSNKDNILYKKG